MEGMKHFMNTKEDVRDPKLKKVLDRIPVIVASNIWGSSSLSYGIQFWTAEQKEHGYCKNTDGTISVYIEHN